MPQDKSAVCTATSISLCWYVCKCGRKGGGGVRVGISIFSDACPLPGLRSGQVHAEAGDYIRWPHKHSNAQISAQTVPHLWLGAETRDGAPELKAV